MRLMRRRADLITAGVMQGGNEDRTEITVNEHYHFNKSA